MSSSDEKNCSQCQNKKRIKLNNSKKQQSTISVTANNNCDYSMPSTSTAQYERPSSPEDNSCVHIRTLVFVKNAYKNVPAPSESFLVGVNCAVVKLLQEIEEKQKCCVKQRSTKQTPKRRQPKS